MSRRVSLISIGESDSKNRAQEAVEKTIHNPLLDVDITNATGVLVNIIGGPDMTLDEYKQVMEIIGEKVAQDAKIISGAQISPDMDKSLRVLLIVTGVKSSQILGSSLDLSINQKQELQDELGIDFVQDN